MCAHTSTSRIKEYSCTYVLYVAHFHLHISMCIFIKDRLTCMSLLLCVLFQVARIFIPYAMRAKKVDMKKLKYAIWDILTDKDNCKVRNHLHART